MKIGSLEINGQLALAPLSGVSDHPFRKLCKEYGADMLYTEFVSSDGLVRGIEKSFEIAQFEEMERPIGIQIYGDNAQVLAESARLIEEKLKPDLIDINYGCPVKKVVKRLAGSACLRDLKILQLLSKAVVDATHLPVTAKIRAGWDADSIVAVEACKALEEIGIKAVTLHPRTRSQFFSGSANWELIAECKQAVSIPIIGNGDIKSGKDALKMLTQTGCDMVMIGRGAMGQPYLFKQIQHFLKTGEELPPPDISERISILRRHIAYAIRIKGESYGIREMRRNMSQYLKGLPGISKLRPKLLTTEAGPELFDLLDEYIANLHLLETLTVEGDDSTEEPEDYPLCEAV